MGSSLPLNYDGIVVDVEDVFAAAYTRYDKYSDKDQEALIMVFFTNDPYIPVVSGMMAGVKGFFDLEKSKRGRIAIGKMMTSICPNLTYPVGDIKDLKKALKSENKVKGNLDKEFMLDKLSDASLGWGIFKGKK